MTWSLTHPGPSERELETDHAEREDDPTPRGVVRAALEAAIDPRVTKSDGETYLQGRPDDHGLWETILEALQAAPEFRGSLADPGGEGPIVKHDDGRVEPIRVLDVCAGYGCWSSEIRRLAALQGWPIHVTGVELHAPRLADLTKWCDEVIIGDWREAMCTVEDTDDGAVDLAIGNPHFTALTHEDPEQSMPAVLLRHAAAVLLYHSVNTFQRSDKGRAVYRATKPAAKWLVPGTVSHDGTSSVSSDCYQVTLWLRGHDGPCAEYLLDVEPEDANREVGVLKRGGAPYKCWRWIVPPGSEDPCEDLPAAPGWEPSP
jgi:hypothetical protein